MKSFFTQHINFAYALIVMTALTLGVGSASAISLSVSSGYALPGQVPLPILHQGGGAQPISDLRLGECPPEAPTNAPCQPVGAALDTRGPLGAISLFDGTVASAFFAVLEDAVFFDQLYVSDDTAASIVFWLAPHGNNIVTTRQVVNVDGDVLATNLVNSTGDKDVCVTQEGDIVLCPNLVLGSCGLAAGHTYSTPPSSNLCSAGTASAVTTNPTTYDWTCTGSGGSVSCQANRITAVNGVCGPAAGHSYSTPPTNGLCNAGNAGSVQTNPTTYSWTCYGTGGGSNDSCSANRVLATNGQCRTYSGTYSTQPATNTSNGCLAGTYSDIADSATQFKWSCLGANGGTNDTPCVAAIAPPANPACFPYTGPQNPQPAVDDTTGCTVGTYSDLADTATEWRWQCSANGTNLTCAADKQTYDGYLFVCGTDPDGPFSAGQSAPANSRWAQWTRGATYLPNGTGDEYPFNMGVPDCSGPTSIVFWEANPWELPNGQDPNNPANDGYDGVMTNPSGTDKLYWKYFCLDAAPNDCFCRTANSTEGAC